MKFLHRSINRENRQDLKTDPACSFIKRILPKNYSLAYEHGTDFCLPKVRTQGIVKVLKSIRK